MTRSQKATTKPTWENYEGETHSYLENGWEISITARVRYSPWGDRDSNIREWFIFDENNELVTKGRADGLRSAKSAALSALDAT